MRQQDVARAHAGGGGRAVGVEIGDHDAAAGQPELGGLLVAEVVGDDAAPAAHHAPVLDDLARHPARQVDRDREADALDAGRVHVLGHDRGVDADQFAAAC